MSLYPLSLSPPRKSRRKQPAKRRRREQPQHSIHVRRVRREQSNQRHAHPKRRSSKQRQRRPSFPSQCHHRTAEGRKAGARPRRLPYSRFIQSAAHRQIGRKRQQHQICPHRRRQAERDRPHRQSLLLHSIALPIPVVQKSVCRKAAFYIQALEKSVQKCAGQTAGAFASG